MPKKQDHNPDDQAAPKATATGEKTKASAAVEPCHPDKKARNLFERARRIALEYEEAERDTDSMVSLPSKFADNPATSGGFRVKCIVLGDNLMNTWYSAPYPEEYSRHSKLYNCEFCLKYMKSGFTAHRHKMKCKLRRPPGDEIYREGMISVFEVDGRKNKIYCQNLCLMAKMFLDHKTLYYDVEPFLFYVLTEVDEDGCHLAGYFSKEKRSGRQYNLSCILTLPHHQRKGYGGFLIDLSYLLSRKEGKLGSPEKPLSDLGNMSYLSYWRSVILLALNRLRNEESISIQDLCHQLGMTSEDVLTTLSQLGMVKRVGSEYQLQIDFDALDSELPNLKLKIAKPDLLRWSPFLIREVDFPTNQSSTPIGNGSSNANTPTSIGSPSTVADLSLSAHQLQDTSALN